MGLGRELLGEYMRHRLYGPRRRRSAWPVAPRPRLTLLPRRHRRTEVRGCGCCLPIPIGVLGATGVGLGLLSRARR